MTTQQLFATDQARFQAWQRFHSANPQVWQWFLRFAREAAAKGTGPIGARFIGERIRWYVNVEIQDRGDFKLNDHIWPYYSRLAMVLYPEEFAGRFEKRDKSFDATDAEIREFHLENVAKG